MEILLLLKMKQAIGWAIFSSSVLKKHVVQVLNIYAKLMFAVSKNYVFLWFNFWKNYG